MTGLPPSTSSSSTGRPWRTSRSPSRRDIRPTASTSSTSGGASASWRWAGSARRKRSPSAFYPSGCFETLFVSRLSTIHWATTQVCLCVQAFDKAVEAIEWSGLKKDVRSDLTSNLQEAFITLAKTAREEGVTESVEPDNLTWQARERLGIPDVLKLTSNNPKMPAASDAVKVVHEPGVGRFVVATRDVQPGEVIFTESPIVSTVCDEHVESIW